VGRFDKALAGLHEVARAGGSAAVDLMLLPQHVDLLTVALPELRRRLPAGMTITFGVLYRSGRETGEHLFQSAIQLEAALDRIAFEAGEKIPAALRKPVAFRREGCDCALGHSINLRSDGALFGCFKMEEQIGHLDSMSLVEAVGRLRDAPQPASSLPRCADCPLATLCGGGCRSENLLMTGHADEPVCDSWRVRVLSELLAEDRVAALNWPAEHLLAEAHHRGIDGPPALVPQRPSTHLSDD
jgi:radical SAM protein with 4Fe4S-binding SPASM domain